jgi:REP element-mobilizing transposase RayT
LLSFAWPFWWEAEGAVYHVIARGNERKAVFRDGRDRQEYLDRLIRCRDRFELRLLAFCLMGNHLHLAVERGPAKLSLVDWRRPSNPLMHEAHG